MEFKNNSNNMQTAGHTTIHSSCTQNVL